MMRSSPVSAAVGALLALTSPAIAQQFQHQAGLIPGPARWSEGVECADVDNDGDLDVFFADGDGFFAPSTQRQNVLLINQLVETGSLAFTDESTTRLGTMLSNAKGVTTADVNGDGWVDALFANAWNTDTPFLYINQGASNPGHFTEESATRGLGTAYSSGNAQFGDLDNDGDLDLILNDAYLGSGSGKPHLFFNDGAGNFTENAAALGAPNKSAQMDVQLIDIDNDFDLDFVGANRASNSGGHHYVMLNDGTGTFSDSSSLLRATSGSVYEVEMGDLDNDDDVDAFFVSLSGFAEGAERNNLIPSFTLSFTPQGALSDSNDDNEIALLDWDNDSDYDVVVGSLSGSRETLWRNNGAFSYTKLTAAITAISDSTLDVAIADLDNDGKYDIVTAQGESNSPQWANKVYKNVGSADTLAPKLIAINAPAAVTSGDDVVVQAKIRDQVMDDGVNYVSAEARYVIQSTPVRSDVDILAGSFSPASITIPVGSSIVFENLSGTNQTVTSTTTPYEYDVTLGNGQLYEQVFVSAGVYDYTSTLGGFNGQVTVTGTPSTADTLYMGGNQYRFEMADTMSGAGGVMCYELRFTDWPGNVRVTNNLKVTLQRCSGVNYCTAGTTTNGCTATMNGVGVASATAGSGFTIECNGMEGQKAGILFYGVNGPAATTWGMGGTSFLCVKSPSQRTGAQNSGGTAGVCDGQMTLDWNAYIAANPGAQGNPFLGGETVWAQGWFRDPPAVKTTSLSDGLIFDVCP